MLLSRAGSLCVETEYIIPYSANWLSVTLLLTFYRVVKIRSRVQNATTIYIYIDCGATGNCSLNGNVVHDTSLESISINVITYCSLDVRQKAFLKNVFIHKSTIFIIVI